jgi:gas vesicle protein
MAPYPNKRKTLLTLLAGAIIGFLVAQLFNRKKGKS